MKYFVWVAVSVSLVACTGATISGGTATPVINSVVTAIPQTALPTGIQPAEIVHANAFPNGDDYEWELLTRGLDRPVDIQSAHDGTDRLFIVEKPGHIRIYE